MANWNGLLLTNKGIALQAKVQAGTQLHITKIKLGSGVVPSGTDIKTLTDLIEPNQNLGIGSKEAVDGYCKISSTISNTDLETGYYVRELGVFAQDPDDGEILYLYTTDSAPDYLPAGGGSTVISQEFSVMIAVDDTNNIKVDIDPAALATIGYVQVQVQEHNAAADTHAPAFEAHNKDLHAHPNRLRPGLKRSTAYAVGDIAFHDSLPSWAYLECTQAGTTAETEPVFGGGKSVSDGTVVWRVKDSRCPYSLGLFVAKMGTPKDYEYLLLCDGSTISQANYPELCAVLGGTQLPNLIGRVLQGNSVGGRYIAAGLPNITGQTNSFHAQSNGKGTFWDGALYTGLMAGHAVNNGTSDVLTYFAFNANLSNNIYGSSNTVQPPAYTTRIYICYAG